MLGVGIGKPLLWELNVLWRECDALKRQVGQLYTLMIDWSVR